MIFGAEWQPFWRELLIRITICSLYSLTYCNFSYFPLWFRARDLVLNGPVPGHHLSFTFEILEHFFSNFIDSLCKI